MTSVSGRAFARLLEQRGWTLLRVSGSHHIYGKHGSPVRLSFIGIDLTLVHQRKLD
jgi:predicted RNA binding protein YcfA (HicA-like mRNA interferase family)